MAKGRPKKEGVVRKPSGDISQKQLKIDHKAYCEKRLIINGLAGVKCEYDDERAGYVLGCICLRGLITKQQLNASNRFAEIAIKHNRIMGYDDLSAKSLDLNKVRGLSVLGDLDEECVMKIRAEYNSIVSYLKHDRFIGGALQDVINIIRDARRLELYHDKVIHAVRLLEKYYYE